MKVQTVQVTRFIIVDDNGKQLSALYETREEANEQLGYFIDGVAIDKAEEGRYVN